MIKILIFTFSLVRKYSKFHFYLNTLISPIIAIIQTFGVISIGLIGMLTEPRVIKENKFFQEYYFLTYENNNELIIQLSTIFLILNILGISLFLPIRFDRICCSKIHALFKKDLMEKYLNNSIKVTSQRTDFHGLISTEVAKFRTCVYSIMSFFHTSTSVLIFLSQ